MRCSRELTGRRKLLKHTQQTKTHLDCERRVCFENMLMIITDRIIINQHFKQHYEGTTTHLEVHMTLWKFLTCLTIIQIMTLLNAFFFLNSILKLLIHHHWCVNTCLTAQFCYAYYVNRRVVWSTERTIRTELPEQQSVYSRRSWTKARKIVKDLSHVNNTFFSLLQSGKCFDSLKANTERLWGGASSHRPLGPSTRTTPRTRLF